MIDLSLSPPLISFAGNPVVVGAVTDNHMVSYGGYAMAELLVCGIDTTPGHGFTLAFGGKSLGFRSAAFTGFDGLLFETAFPGCTFNEFAENIYQCFCENYDIQARYSVTLDPPGVSSRKIILQAREPGSNWTVQLSGVTVSGLTQGQNIPGSDPLHRDYFSILCLVRDSQGGQIGEDIKAVDGDGQVSFDLSDYLRARFASWQLPRFEFPELSGNIRNRGWDYLLRYHLSLAETFDGEIKGLFSDGWKYCLAGGLSRELLTSLNENAQDYFAIDENKRRFLSWQPLTKKSRSGVMEKLFFLFQENPSGYQYRLAVIANFTDGTHKMINASPLAVFPSFTVVEFKVGYDHLELVNAQVGKTISGWEVFLLDGNDDFISERRIYLNDTRVIENEKVFFYRNSFSAYDTFRFTGKSELNLEYDRLGAVALKQERYSFFNAPSVQFSILETESCKANSGWVSKDEKQCLREMLLSPECYEQIGAELFRIVIKTAKITPFLKDGEYLYSLEIEYERSWQNAFFSRHTPQGLASQVVALRALCWDTYEVTFDNAEITFDQVEY